MTTTVVILALIAFAVIAAFVIVTRMLFICPPNEVLIFSGTHRRISSSDGRVVGYRLVQGGRGVRIPLFEVVDRMNLTNMVIDLRVSGAYSKGGIPLNVQGVANVKISSQTTQLANAIERFLGRKREDIMNVARETLEGNLRGVLAMLTPEEVNTDREKFAQALLHEADTDLGRLGLELDTLKVQSVSDDKGYLESLGRRQTAELIKRSRISEADNKALSAERAAENLRTQELAKVDAEILQWRAYAAGLILDAQTGKEALIAEARGAVQALVAKSIAEVEVQRARLEQVRYQLIADEVRPAEARRARKIAEAHGAAATLKEEGRASADAIRSLGATWVKNGENARQIFVAQKLTPLVRALMSTVGKIEVNKLSLIDRNLSQGGGGGNAAVNAATFAEQLKQTTGVDLVAMATNRTKPT
ncbi:MAG: flotillin family protein [Myxococcales bacterium]|nr:flotillin family protein [Myxococcales bacterium]